LGAIAVVALVVVPLVPTARSRVRLEHKDLIHERARARSLERLHSIITRFGGPAAVLRCGRPMTWVAFQSIVAWETGLNVGVVGFNPPHDLKLKQAFVYFEPNHLGWRVRLFHLAPADRAACVPLAQVTATR
jgi:hypothetical protein